MRFFELRHFLLCLLVPIICPSLLAQPAAEFALRHIAKQGDTLSFEVHMRVDSPNVALSRGQIYLDYNAAAFGDSVVKNGTLVVERIGVLAAEVVAELAPGVVIRLPKFRTVGQIDNTASRFAITYSLANAFFGDTLNSPRLARLVADRWIPLYRLSLVKSAPQAEVGISLYKPLMQGQQFYLTAPNLEASFSLQPPFWQTLSGEVYVDKNGNCARDPEDFPLVGYRIVSDSGAYVGLTDTDGHYEILVLPGGYRFSLADDPPARLNLCPPTGTYPWNSGEAGLRPGRDFAVQPEACAYLELQIGAEARRPCSGRRLRIQYRNQGGRAASDAKLRVAAREGNFLVAADRPYQTLPDSNWEFSLDTIPPGGSGVVEIVDSVGCGANVANQVPLLSASISPRLDCPSRQTGWSGARTEVFSHCDPDPGYVVFVLKNTGSAPHTDSLRYQIYASDTLILEKNYLLAPGDSIRCSVEHRGQAIRVEAQQERGYPGERWFSKTITECGNDSLASLLARFPTQDFAFEQLYREASSIRQNLPRSERYVIAQNPWLPTFTNDSVGVRVALRLQNPSTQDTLFAWWIADTLPAGLDLMKIRLGPGSHRYHAEIERRDGHSILQLEGREPLLPGATFSLRYEMPLEPGFAANGRVCGQATMGFDTTRTEGIFKLTIPVRVFPPESCLSLQTAVRNISPGRIVRGNVRQDRPIPSQVFLAFPNPVTDEIFLERSSPDNEAAYFIVDVKGRQVQAGKLRWRDNQAQISVEGLSPGTYFLKQPGGAIWRFVKR